MVTYKLLFWIERCKCSVNKASCASCVNFDGYWHNDMYVVFDVYSKSNYSHIKSFILLCASCHSAYKDFEESSEMLTSTKGQDPG